MNTSIELSDWHKMVGGEAKDENRLELKRTSGLDVSGPKEGKVDPENTPHVGGNTWKGGTGGRDTAGLGGKGGPYRLDAGHDVHQIPDWEKQQVPPEIQEKAKEMGRKAFEKRLKEIKMSKHDANTYKTISDPVQKQVASIRRILDSLEENKKGERIWLKNQTDGEWDDAKLVERVVGERNVFKRRVEEDSLHGEGDKEALPRRLKLVVDVSGSMYRFNGLDGRLKRSAEAVCMVMEGLEGHSKKVKYDIVGHSGDSPCHSLSRLNHEPKNDKERLKVLEHMYAYSQFCQSGDHTVEAIEHAVKSLKMETDGDNDSEKYVLVLSDANLERYGIRSSTLSRALLTAKSL